MKKAVGKLSPLTKPKNIKIVKRLRPITHRI